MFIVSSTPSPKPLGNVNETKVEHPLNMLSMLVVVAKEFSPMVTDDKLAQPSNIDEHPIDAVKPLGKEISCNSEQPLNISSVYHAVGANPSGMDIEVSFEHPENMYER